MLAVLYLIKTDTDWILYYMQIYPNPLSNYYIAF